MLVLEQLLHRLVLTFQPVTAYITSNRHERQTMVQISMLLVHGTLLVRGNTTTCTEAVLFRSTIHCPERSRQQELLAVVLEKA
jgi:putative effector of murein hydrolase LrgA (UPF0299 family)